MNTVTQYNQAELSEIASVESLLNPTVDIDELLELASKFSVGQLILSGAAQSLLIRLLERKAKQLLRPGDEIRQLNVSVKKKKMAIHVCAFAVASSETAIVRVS